MQLDRQVEGQPDLSRCFALPTPCPYCGDTLVAPIASEFVEGGEIRHHWACETCSSHSLTSVSVAIGSSH
ncbi:MAG TPA: hypothetical protein VFX37_02280 [Pseudolabrys sp.]|nr:hypothetical protein [Pseudolabrys sp.]